MTDAAAHDAPLDLLIIGAGLSGIGLGCTLRRDAPHLRFEIMEARDALGGTWDLFRYPGIRSDSDLYTFGYAFKPWRSDKLLADGAEIRAYLQEAADEYEVTPRIRFGRKAIRAAWDSAAALWTVTLACQEGGEETRRARWLFCATGYYDYEAGHAPGFAGAELYQGALIHPQNWPQDFEPKGKRIALIGSGATAVTLAPALAARGAQVVMIQRTPSYILPLPSTDALARLARRLLPEARAFALNRRRFIAQQRWLVRLCQRYPKTARRLIRAVNRLVLPRGYPVDTHFNPPYDPWDQRLCAAADGDFFAAIRKGGVEMATDAVERLTPRGLALRSGREIAADAIVTATGLRLKLFGGVDVTVDGQPMTPQERLVFRGAMLDGMPNFCFAVGYTTSAWPLKIGLLCDWLSRLLAQMEAAGMAVCTPIRPAADMPTRPLLDFGAGYVQRSIDMLPRQGARDPWRMSFDYREDRVLLAAPPISDPALRFDRAPAA